MSLVSGMVDVGRGSAAQAPHALRLTLPKSVLASPRERSEFPLQQQARPGWPRSARRGAQALHRLFGGGGAAVAVAGELNGGHAVELNLAESAERLAQV